ncbi:hypothetical protein Aperf_G00000007747 [Anoplocephala perfoliata]
MLPQPPVESGCESPAEGRTTADLMQAILADLKKLGSLQSELVLHNGKRLDEHAQSAETLHKINQLLNGVQTRNEASDNGGIHYSAIDQVKDSVKSLSEVKYRPTNSHPSSAIPNAHFNPSLKEREIESVLTPRQLCPLRNDLPASDEEMAIFEGEATFAHQDDSKVPVIWLRALPLTSVYKGPVRCQDSYINQFEQELAEQRRCLEKQQAEEMEQALQDCEKRLREEYEAKLENNYHLIEQLITEKKELMEQCDKLVSDLRQMSEKALAKQKLMEENHRVELKKAEAKAVAAEKIKRERWEAAKTKSIKELAAKGVERDIQRMKTDHIEEMEELKRYYKEQLEAADVRASEKYSQKIEEFRLKLAKDREDICAQERKYEALLEEERQVWDNLRKKLLKEADEGKERVMNQAARERTEMEERLGQLNATLAEASQKQLQDIELVKKEMAEEYKADLLKLQTRLESEKASVEETVRAQLLREFQEREREIADRLRKERDHQIEAVIQRLEEESSRIRDETENSAQEKIKRLKEKHRKDIDELEAAEREAKEKYNHMRTKCVELEGEMSCQTVRMTQLAEELRQVQAKNDQLNGEREQLREVLTREVEVELAEARASATRAQCEAAEMKAQAASKVARLQTELNASKRDAAEELESLHQKYKLLWRRIKEAIVKKDMKIAELVRRHEKEVRELRAVLNTRATFTSNNASTMDGESGGAVGSGSNTSACVRRGMAKTRVAASRGH